MFITVCQNPTCPISNSHASVAKICSAPFQTGFYINGSGLKERESLFLSESLYIEGTQVDVEET